MVKRIFPIIIALTIVSVLGLIYLQYQWIDGAMKLKKEQYENDIYSCLDNIKDSINARKDHDAIGFNFPFKGLSFNNYVPTSSVLSQYELKDIIKSALRKKMIKQPFEFCITNEARIPIMFSTGFKEDYFSSANNYPKMLSGENIVNNEMLNIYIIEPENYFQKHLATLLLFSILFTSVIIAAFVLTIRTMFSQKKLSEIKSDFISNMTHEFKTPIATISLASDALKNEKVISNRSQIEYYNGIIKEENKRMNQQVEKILQASQLEKDEIKMSIKKLNVHEIIQRVAENTSLQMQEAHVVFSTELEASNCIIEADEVHFTNIIFNLLDNAIKYSKENPIIKISTSNEAKMISIKVTDNGIGMDRDTQNNVYEKFFRAHTGNLHNVKGFGLGLTYVKKIVEAHKGKIELSSELGVGTTFTIRFSTV